MVVGLHLHNLPFREGCAGSQWGVDGKGWGGEFGGRGRGGRGNVYKVPIVQSQDREKCPVGPGLCV